MEKYISIGSLLGNGPRKEPIKVLVSKKFDLSYENGSPTRLKINLKDESGEIQATVCEKLVARYNGEIQVGKEYIIRNFLLKPANKDCGLGHDCQVQIDDDTQVDDFHKLNIVQIGKLHTDPPENLVDIVAICQDVLPSGQENKKKVVLVDKSCASIPLLVWREQAEKFQGRKGDIFLIKKAKVNKLKDKCFLTVFGLENVEFIPNIPEIGKLLTRHTGEGVSRINNNVSAQRSERNDD